MRNEKIYRMKDLSLELLADMVKSNRTYCSRAINTFSGMSFNRYLDTFRIAEATSIIADSSNDILFKQLADSVGYNSVAVFQKLFYGKPDVVRAFIGKKFEAEKLKSINDAGRGDVGEALFEDLFLNGINLY